MTGRALVPVQAMGKASSPILPRQGVSQLSHQLQVARGGAISPMPNHHTACKGIRVLRPKLWLFGELGYCFPGNCTVHSGEHRMQKHWDFIAFKEFQIHSVLRFQKYKVLHFQKYKVISNLTLFSLEMTFCHQNDSVPGTVHVTCVTFYQEVYSQC